LENWFDLLMCNLSVMFAEVLIPGPLVLDD